MTTCCELVILPYLRYSSSKFMAKQPVNPADFIVPLNISGLQGRMLHVPAPKAGQREMLFIYGHHSTLERWWGLVEVFNEFGSVTMPDLPGLGGMDSFYKVGQKPTVDAMADYLAAFIKWRYKRSKKFTIIGMSFGFVVATRMLQRYPELVDKVDFVVSLVGFAHKDDFTFSRSRVRFYKAVSRVLSLKIPAVIFRYVALNRWTLRTFYAKTHNAKKKFANAETAEDFDRLMQVEIDLWHKNDVRTQMFTGGQFFSLDNCKSQVALPVWHVTTQNDHFFDHAVVEQHLRVIFSDFHEIETTIPNHAPSVIADAEMAAPLVPSKLRKILSAVLD
jgi:pimeloyl-ACP methyl ester carboxylesterase